MAERGPHKPVGAGSSPAAPTSGDGVTANISVSKTDALGSNPSRRVLGSWQLFLLMR